MNQGFKNENDICNYLNGKKFAEYNDFWKAILNKIFVQNDDSNIFICRIIGKGCKTDIEIVKNREIKRISVKSGDQVSMHAEHLNTFIPFLRSLKISERTLKILLLYHFGDGTLDGSGTTRLDAAEMKAKWSKLLKEANRELSLPANVSAIAYRCIIKGKLDNRKEIDYLYYGNVNNGELISKESIMSLVVQKRCLFLITPHFGPLIYQPLHRNLRSNVNQKYRYFMQIKWPTLFADMQKINTAIIT